MTVPTRYRHTGLVLVRATTDPGDLDLPTHLDLSDAAAVEQEGRAWLAKIWSRADVRDALRLASPALGDAHRPAPRPAPDTATQGSAPRHHVRGLLPAALAAAAPPRSGCSPGSPPPTIGPSGSEVGDGHRALVARSDAEWLATLVDQLEAASRAAPPPDGGRRQRRFVRDGRFIVAARAELGALTPGRCRRSPYATPGPCGPRWLGRLADPVRRAGRPAWPPSSPPPHRTQIRGTAARPDRPAHPDHEPAPADDGRRRPGPSDRCAARRRAPSDMPDIAALLDELEEISDHLARHNSSADPQQAAANPGGG